jgi:hypothetical protein
MDSRGQALSRRTLGWARSWGAWRARTKRVKRTEAGIRQSEKYGHDGMADDLRAALVGLGE